MVGCFRTQVIKTNASKDRRVVNDVVDIHLIAIIECCINSLRFSVQAKSIIRSNMEHHCSDELILAAETVASNLLYILFRLRSTRVQGPLLENSHSTFPN